MSKQDLIEHIPDIIFSVSIVCVFIGTFFFTYGSYLEKRIVLRQMSIIVNNFATDLDALSPSLTNTLRPTFAALEAPDMKEEDDAAEKNNVALMQKAAIVLFSLFVLGSAISIAILIHRKQPVIPFIQLNLFILVFVACTYAMFSTFIIGEYQYADTNKVKLTLLQTL